MTIGFLPSWTDAVNNAYLLQDQFEKMGFTVEMEELTEPGLLYTALAEGDVDNEFDDGDEPAAIDAWLAEYGDQFEWVVD
ncbi:glycine betaine ABC transporter substrate-binding protein [Microbacterium sp. ZXX196]|uniref:glycine betaine ABC transporter substrate-binding protein n=1 Tax=Microbacterium sp. ZXX196 TaxID=2609291 RepID=UPI0018ACF1F8|nr:glycine betaine ABC transporter substrate-binding protein [Microbacterium sp. ZXX196]